MAIQDSFNLSKATTSQAYAYKCWYNYNYGGNTMKISAKDMGELTQTWSGELKNWRATASNDENAYEIDDDDFSTAKANGADSAKDKTGYSGGKGGMVARDIVDGLSAASGVATTLGANFIGSSGSQAVANLFNTGTEKIVGQKLASKSAEKAATATAGSSGKKSGSWIVAAPLSMATGIAYKTNKPNQEQKEACEELRNTMNDAQASLQMAQSDMATAGDEIVDLSDEAQAYNEDANSDIEDKKTEYDMYKASYDALMEKAKSGEPLSEDEKALLKELVPLMQQLGIDIGDLSDETTDKVGDIYAQMGDYQETYDNAASTMGEVEGVTDYAESFDETTKNSCIAQGIIQGLNATSGASAGLKAGKFAASGGWITAWAWGFAAMGATGAALSGTGALEQKDWAGKVSDEIDARKITQDLNSGTTDLYDENIDIYAGQMEGVEDLELEIPEEMEAPEDVMSQLTGGTETVLAQSAPASGTNSGAITTGTTNGGTTPGTVADDKDKDKKV